MEGNTGSGDFTWRKLRKWAHNCGAPVVEILAEDGGGGGGHQTRRYLPRYAEREALSCHDEHFFRACKPVIMAKWGRKIWQVIVKI